jgi:hypothetical protein
MASTSVRAAVEWLGGGVGDHELELAAGGAGQLGAALDGDLRVVDAELVELLGDGLAEAGLQSVVAGCRGVVGDDQDAQDRAVLDDLELANLGVAGEQGELQGVDAKGSCRNYAAVARVVAPVMV